MYTDVKMRRVEHNVPKILIAVNVGTNWPIWCESFSAAILTLRVSHAKNDPKMSRIPLKPYTKSNQITVLFIAQ